MARNKRHPKTVNPCAACLVPWANPPRRHSCKNPSGTAAVATCHVCGNLEYPKKLKAGVCAFCREIYGDQMPAALYSNNPATLADAAENWARARGFQVPARSSAAWKGMYSAWQKHGMASNPGGRGGRGGCGGRNPLPLLAGPLAISAGGTYIGNKASKFHNPGACEECGSPCDSPKLYMHGSPVYVCDGCYYRNNPAVAALSPAVVGGISGVGLSKLADHAWPSPAVVARRQNPGKKVVTVPVRGGYLHHPKIQVMRDSDQNRAELVRFHANYGERVKFVEASKNPSRAVTSHQKALDSFITKKMPRAAKQTQHQLVAALKARRYTRARAYKAWRKLIDQACRASKIPMSAAARAGMASGIAQEFEAKIRRMSRGRHKNPLMAGLVEGIGGGAAFAITSALIRRKTGGRAPNRAPNPALAVVGAGLTNPTGRKSYTSKPGSATRGPKTTRNSRGGDRGLKKVVTLADARQIASKAGKIREFNMAVEAHKKFHGYKGTLPDTYPVYYYSIADRQKNTTLKIGSATGRVPETTYHRTPADSNKAGKLWVHEHPPGGEPLEVWLPHEKMAIKIGGKMRRTDWYRS